jgi:hypothetical protein
VCVSDDDTPDIRRAPPVWLWRAGREGDLEVAAGVDLHVHFSKLPVRFEELVRRPHGSHGILGDAEAEVAVVRNRVAVAVVEDGVVIAYFPFECWDAGNAHRVGLARDVRARVAGIAGIVAIGVGLVGVGYEGAVVLEDA